MGVRKLLRLADGVSSGCAFDAVAVVVAVSDVQHVKSRYKDGEKTAVVTIWLEDGSLEGGVSVCLWAEACVRAATLRTLDIVFARSVMGMVREKGKEKEKEKGKGKGKGEVEVKLVGDMARISLLPDHAVIGEGSEDRDEDRDMDMDMDTDTERDGEGDGDSVNERARRVIQWRDRRFRTLSKMRANGAVWAFDRVRHGHGHGHHGIQAARPRSERTRTGQEGEGEEEERRGKKKGEAYATFRELIGGGGRGDVDGVRFESISFSNGLCWFGCDVCGASDAKEKEERRCRGCGGCVRWRFAVAVARVRDASGRRVTATVGEACVQRVLFGASAADVMVGVGVGGEGGGEGGAEGWARDVLCALVSEEEEEEEEDKKRVRMRVTASVTGESEVDVEVHAIMIT